MTRAGYIDLGLVRVDYLAKRIALDDNGCWIWLGGIEAGYGRAWIAGRGHPAHRVVYELMVGRVDPDLAMDHLCRVRACVNPDHLEPVTHRTNVLRGINHVADQVQRTHCPHGHAYTPENTYIRRSGRRACRACGRLRSSAYYWKHKAAA